MKITVSNKKITQKPAKEEAGKFFSQKGKNAFKWTEIECSVEQFKTLVENGYTITYLHNEVNSMKRKGNYRGTQFICVDVDETDFTGEELVGMMKYKPTMYHTTFSHKTEHKNFKNCYHFYFVLNEVVSGEDNFTRLFKEFSSGIEDIYDKCADDCNRVSYTSNKILPNFEYHSTGIIYNVSDILKEDNSTVSFDDFINDNWEKNESLNISNPLYNISSGSKISQKSDEINRNISNDFNLDATFFKDLNTLQRSDFIAKYSVDYYYITETVIPRALFEDKGYADLRGYDYFVVPSAQYSWDATENKAIIRKIQNGHRTLVLWLDAVAFMHIIPNITKEYLVWLLVKEVYAHFMNGDGQLNNWFIINKAKDVWNNIDNIDIKPIKKTLKLDMGYWREKGISNPLEATRNAMKDMKSKDFGSVYDFSMTLEENVKVMKEYGINTTKKTVIKWLDENNLEYTTEKDFRDKMVIYFYDEDNTRSSRDIEKLCKDNNVKVSYKTIQTILLNYKLSIQD